MDVKFHTGIHYYPLLANKVTHRDDIGNLVMLEPNWEGETIKSPQLFHIHSTAIQYNHNPKIKSPLAMVHHLN